ncbi:MAG: hypothetical protein WDM91_11135 [Rhizomicrobium sp.]
MVETTVALALSGLIVTSRAALRPDAQWLAQAASTIARGAAGLNPM